MQTGREIQYERQFLAKVGYQGHVPSLKSVRGIAGMSQSTHAPADAYHRIKYLERGLILDTGQIDRTVPLGINQQVFTLGKQA